MGDLVLMKIQYKLKLLNVCKWCEVRIIYIILIIYIRSLTASVSDNWVHSFTVSRRMIWVGAVTNGEGGSLSVRWYPSTGAERCL